MTTVKQYDEYEIWNHPGLRIVLKKHSDEERQAMGLPKPVPHPAIQSGAFKPLRLWVRRDG